MSKTIELPKVDNRLSQADNITNLGRWYDTNTSHPTVKQFDISAVGFTNWLNKNYSHLMKEAK